MDEVASEPSAGERFVVSMLGDGLDLANRQILDALF
jgi:hypothetical protein